MTLFAEMRQIAVESTDNKEIVISQSKSNAPDAEITISLSQVETIVEWLVRLKQEIENMNG